MLLAATALFALPAQAADDKQAKVDALFADWGSTATPGCSVAATQDGKLLYSRGYGMANLEYDVPNRARTKFHVASVSKQFTAASIALLVLEKKISLDDPVRKYVPELGDFGTPLLVRHLVHHTSGLRDHWEILDFSGWRYSHDLITDDDVLSVLSLQKRLGFAPGAKYQYSNSNYLLMAKIVERVSGQSLREFTTERLFKPLGMNDTHFRDDFTEIQRDFAYGYGREAGVFKTSVTNFNTVGATSLLTTAEDLMRWQENLRSGRIGGQAFIAQMLERDRLNDGSLNDYAFGVVHGEYRGLRTVGHSGSDAGYLSQLIGFPEQRFDVAVLCNVNEVDTGKLARGIATIYLGELMKPEPADKKAGARELTLSARQLQDRIGIYLSNRATRALIVETRDGQLHATAGEYGLDLIARSPHRFETRKSGSTLEFSREAGSSQRVTTQFGDETQVYERVPAFEPTAGTLQQYAGRYESDEVDAPFYLWVQDGELQLRSIKLRQRLRAITQEIFIGDWMSIRFTRDQGRITGFEFGQGDDARYVFVRRP
ncbi:serine hydrolase domain-containing protein [Steroidobacter sp.]|uniref:serine hydrolase domain-containing protein n=1 Tax=Steroidobacter sp. TaxID=1978227 RepID=UPI001A5DE358|nr:serine hydrolase domain-containing protein [Steroidobacter sp.]MBL8268646.1 beta-lactamase family protein [Steroidobacter sp.]